MKEMPFFYFDIRARVIPGALCLALFGLFNMKVPQPYSFWFEGSEAWKAVVVPLLLVTGAYFLGDIIEATIRWSWDILGYRAFQRAFFRRNGKELEPSEFASKYRHSLWHWAVVTVSKEYPQAFIHPHRFQSEAKMFLNSSVPAAIILGRLFYLQSHHLLASWLLSILVFEACARLSFSCEIRRWVQVLGLAEELLVDPLKFIPKDEHAESQTAGV